VDATVVEVTRASDGSCTYHYSYQDTMGEFRQGRFWRERETWRFGDKGKVSVDPLAPEKSVWLVESEPRAPEPLKTAPGRGCGALILRFLLATSLLAFGTGAVGVYFFWEKIFAQYGILGGLAEIGPVAILSLLLLFTLIAGLPVMVFVVFWGSVAQGVYIFARNLGRDS
jgi:hypothetical protein